jgi:DNA-binding winged helix-turn-helix (wHTH) protein
LIDAEPPPIDEAVFSREHQSVIVGGEYRRLRNTAWRLLELFWKRLGHTVHRESIRAAMWAGAGDSNNTAVQAFAVRKALEGSPYRLVVVRGLGYRLEPITSVAPLLVPVDASSRAQRQRQLCGASPRANPTPISSAPDA